MSTRRTDVDLVRFAALAAMYVAHVAPSRGPAHVLELSEYTGMPLFALLIGVGAQLGVWSRRTRLRWWWSMAVRATVVIGLGLVLERAGSQVVVVLAHVGVLIVVAGLVARLPTPAVAVVGVAAFAVGQLLVERAVPRDVLGAGWSADLAGFVWADGPYRLLPMVVYAVAGVLLSRWWLRGALSRAVLVPALVGAGCLLVGASMFAAEQLGRIDLVPDSGTTQETVLQTLLSAGLLGCGLALARALDSVAAGRPVVAGLAAAGAMTLTLYVSQVLWLAYDVRVLHPGETDNSWANLGVLLAGSLVIAWGWPALVRREPWRRGPIEGPIIALSRAG